VANGAEGDLITIYEIQNCK